MSNEFDLILQIASSSKTDASDVQLGIGDDCAVWNVGESRVLLAADMLLEGVHFDLTQLTFYQVGRKALAVNLSDIAAMGGEPKTALVSLAVPSSCSIIEMTSLMDGLIALGREYGVTIVGGDTTSHDGPLMINVAITGLSHSSPILRSGAKEGDFLFVTGALGGSISGHHWSFTPRVREAIQLDSSFKINSMIDLSDGLASDIRHIAEASSLGCILEERDIPISDRVNHNLSDDQRIYHALSDGEDYELLFTVSQDDAEKLRKQNEIDVHQIGQMQGGPDQIMMKKIDGSLVELPDSGWKHSLK